MSAEFTVFARDRDLTKLGTINGYRELQCTPRFNAVGSWSLTYPIGSRGASLLAAGRGVRIFRRGLPPGTPPLLTGPVMYVGETLDSDRKTPLVKFTGVCDNIWLAGRRMLPDPTTDGDVYADAYDTRSGVGETVMKAFVNLNAGPGALPVRRVPGLVVAGDIGRGGSTSFSGRFQSLLEGLQEMGLTAGLGFRVVQLRNQLVFDVYEPADRSKLVRFDVSTRSLGAYDYSLTGPTATAVYVGDGDPGTGRSFQRFVDTEGVADWGRFETFVDKADSQDASQITQAGADALVKGAAQAQVTFEPRDTPQHRYGLDFGLGDTVTVRVRLGDVADVVREVTLSDTSSDGVKVRPTVGGTEASDPANNTRLYKTLNNLARAVGYLQRRL